MGKPTICIGENKSADQLRGYREADQRLCFRYRDSTIPLLSKSKISSLQLSSVAVQPGLCRTCSETKSLVFPRDGSYFKHDFIDVIITCKHYKNLPMQYTEIFSSLKMENFIRKKNDIFDIFAQNINCGYTLELPRRGEVNESIKGKNRQLSGNGAIWSNRIAQSV